MIFVPEARAPLRQGLDLAAACEATAPAARERELAGPADDRFGDEAEHACVAEAWTSAATRERGRQDRTSRATVWSP